MRSTYQPRPAQRGRTRANLDRDLPGSRESPPEPELDPDLLYRAHRAIVSEWGVSTTERPASLHASEDLISTVPIDAIEGSHRAWIEPAESVPERIARRLRGALIGDNYRRVEISEEDVETLRAWQRWQRRYGDNSLPEVPMREAIIDTQRQYALGLTPDPEPTLLDRLSAHLGKLGKRLSEPWENLGTRRVIEAWKKSRSTPSTSSSEQQTTEDGSRSDSAKPERTSRWRSFQITTNSAAKQAERGEVGASPDHENDERNRSRPGPNWSQ